MVETSLNYVQIFSIRYVVFYIEITFKSVMLDSSLNYVQINSLRPIVIYIEISDGNSTVYDIDIQLYKIYIVIYNESQ